tara:strand:- start:202 stop:492 length:291 start_codon:yes stop_codon:yes gene_type:complete
MINAIWKDQLLAQSENYEIVDGNKYFPPSSLNMKFFRPSQTKSTCPWKGVANYYDIEVDGMTNKDAAWFYPETKPAAENIKGYVSFWRGVKITSSN